MYLILFKKQTPVRKVSEEAGDRVKNVFFFGGGAGGAQSTGGGSGAAPDRPCPSSWQERIKYAAGPFGGWQRREGGAWEF